MSKNTKHKNYKSYLRLLDEEEKLENIRRNLGYRELEQPRHHGYEAYLVLRDDIANREDSYIYQHLIDNYASVTWSKDGVFNYKKRGYVIDNTPIFRRVDENHYNNLDSRILKHFVHDRFKDESTWFGIKRYFYSYVPSYYFVMEIRKSYLTHEKIIDGELEREISFVKDKLNHLRRVTPVYNENGYSDYKDGFNRSDRRFNKMALRKNLSADYAFDDFDFPDWKDVDWTDWAHSSGWSHDPQEFRYKTRSQAKWMWW
jgi:hypothetical protein